MPIIPFGMDQWYETLRNELLTDELGWGYASMTDEEAAAKLNERNRRVPTQRFISMRAIAAVLDDLVFHYQQ